MLVKWKRTRTNTIVCKVVLSADSAGREVGDQSCKRNEDLSFSITYFGWKHYANPHINLC